MTNLDAKYRVVRLPESLREAIRQARDAKKQTNAEFVGKAVEDQLPTLMKALTKLGFDRLVGEARPIRLPFADKYGGLDLLRQASETVALPATHLLTLCLAAATKETESTSTRRTRRRQSAARAKQAGSRKAKGRGRKPQ